MHMQTLYLLHHKTIVLSDHCFHGEHTFFRMSPMQQICSAEAFTLSASAVKERPLYNSIRH